MNASHPMQLKKKGVSPIIATVLLLLITVVAAGIISVFVVPFVRESLSDSGECFEIRQAVVFAETPYLCYVDNQDPHTAFSVKLLDDRVIGFTVSLYNQGIANTFDIKDGTIEPSIKMLDSTSENLEIPPVRGVRTYVVDGVYDRIELFPIVQSGNQCDLTDKIEITSCTDDTVIAAINAP